MVSDETLAEVRAVSHANRPYWRVMLSPDEPLFVVACLQPWDECDYDQDRFLSVGDYDEATARSRCDNANRLMPPHLRTLANVRLLRRVHGL